MRLLGLFLVFLLFKQGNSTTYQCNEESSCGCSSSSTVLTRIVGGEAAAQGTWTWSVSLRDNGTHICGASILTPYFVITAAHCVEPVHDPARLSILAGSITVTPSSSNKVSQTRSIAQIHMRSDYNKDSHINDMALLRLSSPLNMTSGNLRPICLPTGTTVQPVDNINLIAIGWGVTSMDSDTTSPILRQVTIKSISSTDTNCQSTVDDSRFQFCAGLPEGTKDTCQGDSGGPLMAFVDGLWQLQGLTSYGYGCALAGHPGVYTRVSAYISWIKTITQSDQTTSTATTTRTTQRGSSTTTTTTHGESTNSQYLANSTIETSSKTTGLSNTNNSTKGPIEQGSSGAEHSTTHSVIMAVVLPVMISSYSFVLLIFL